MYGISKLEEIIIADVQLFSIWQLFIQVQTDVYGPCHALDVSGQATAQMMKEREKLICPVTLECCLAGK